MTDKEDVQKALDDALRAFPELRVGQLIWNATGGADLFYMNDFQLAELLRAHTERHR